MEFITILGIGALSLAFGLLGSCGALWLVLHLMVRHHGPGWPRGQSTPIAETVAQQLAA